MSRYRIVYKDGSTREADDAKIEGGLVHHLARDTHDYVADAPDKVKEIRKSNPGPWQGGKRFDGTHSGSFSATPGSIGNSGIEDCVKDGYVVLKDGTCKRAESIKTHGQFVEYWDVNSEMWRAVNSSEVSRVTDARRET